MRKYRKIWESLGENEAYFAVITHQKYLTANLDDNSVDEFYRSGQDYFNRILRDFEKSFGMLPRPRVALDYGCGAGRVIAAMADVAERVVGVDISRHMLDKTAARLEGIEKSDFELLEPDEFISGNEMFDLVHTVIVLQHIHPRDGLKIISKMVERLRPDGFGVVHVTYFDSPSAYQRIKSGIYNFAPILPSVVARLRGVVRHWMPMYNYDLNQVFRVLQENDCHRIAVKFSDHGRYGMLILFQRSGTIEY